jgi:peptide/nickel transport system permease protein
VTAYVVRRLLLVPVVLLLLSALVFWGIRLIPGDVVDFRLESSYTPERAQQLRDALGLNRPLWQAYPAWLAGALSGDLGKSFISDRPVTSEILERLPVTVELLVLSLLIQVVVGIPLGILAALYHRTLVDRLVLLGSIVALAIPSFWMATLVLTLPSLFFRWSPPFGYTPFFDDPLRNLYQFSIPAAIIGLFLTAIILRLTRAEMLEVLRQEYITTARAKGLGERVVLLRHALKNALIPVVTVLGLAAGSSIAGAVIIEHIFALPGLGSYGVDAVVRRDYTAVQGFVMVVGLAYVFLNLVVDMLYSYLNPRIKYG